jgi:hypothetical protein
MVSKIDRTVDFSKKNPTTVDFSKKILQQSIYDQKSTKRQVAPPVDPSAGSKRKAKVDDVMMIISLVRAR